MKVMAKELDIPVLLLSQLNRGIDMRKGSDAEPVLSDLRESGAIEQDADIVLFIHKPKTEGIPEEDEDGINRDYDAKIKIAKHRNGETGSFNLHWHGEWTTFENITGGNRPHPTENDPDISQTIKPQPTDATNTPVPLPEIVPVQDSTVSDVW
jgi:replicative DNA helicase